MIYLDNSATTKPAKEVAEVVSKHLSGFFANPSSTHELGNEEAKKVAEARETVADFLGVQKNEIYFTSGGTESDNIAILGSANIKKGKRIVTTAVEHPAVLRTVEHLEKQGFEVIKLLPETDGRVSVERFYDAINEDTSLVSCMHVNNETGAIMPVDKIKEIIEEKAPGAVFHTDAVQSFGHIKLNPKKWGIDMLSISGHKIHAPKGTGVLYVRNGVNLHSPSYGGNQEKYRSGTLNTSGILGLKKAVELINLSDNEKVGLLKKQLLENALSVGNAHHNGGECESPYILNISFEGIRSETLLNALSMEGVYVSAGSACSSSKERQSYVLKAMGVKHFDNAIRFSFSRYTTKEEIDEASRILLKTVKMLRGGK